MLGDKTDLLHEKTERRRGGGFDNQHTSDEQNLRGSTDDSSLCFCRSRSRRPRFITLSNRRNCAYRCQRAVRRGLILLLLAFGPIRRAIQIAPEPQACATLVTRGVYKRFRHPIYTSIVMLVGGLFLRKPTIVVGIAAAVVIVFLVTKVQFEERLLLAHYPEYSEYKSRTWGIVPCRADDRTGRHHHLVDPG